MPKSSAVFGRFTIVILKIDEFFGLFPGNMRKLRDVDMS